MLFVSQLTRMFLVRSSSSAAVITAGGARYTIEGFFNRSMRQERSNPKDLRNRIVYMMRLQRSANCKFPNFGDVHEGVPELGHFQYKSPPIRPRKGIYPYPPIPPK